MEKMVKSSTKKTSNALKFQLTCRLLVVKSISFQELARLQQSSYSKNHSCQFTYIVAITPGVYSDGLAQFTDLGGEPRVRIWTSWFNCTTLSVKSVSDNHEIIMYS